MNPLVRQSATTAGFAADAELDSKLTVFALLVQQQRNRELMKMMHQYMRQDIGACADTCRAVGQVTAANWLQAHADSLVLDWDAITLLLPSSTVNPGFPHFRPQPLYINQSLA